MASLRSSAVSLLVSYVVLMVISLVAVILRFISRRILQGDIKVDDILCVVSLVSQEQFLIERLFLREAYSEGILLRICH